MKKSYVRNGILFICLVLILSMVTGCTQPAQKPVDGNTIKMM